MSQNTETSVGWTFFSSDKWTPIIYMILEKHSEYWRIVWFQLSHQITNHKDNVKYCHYLTLAEQTNVKLLKMSRVMNAPIGKHLSKKCWFSYLNPIRSKPPSNSLSKCRFILRQIWSILYFCTNSESFYLHHLWLSIYRNKILYQ